MIKNITILFVFLIFLSNPSFSNWIDGNVVTLQGLDKITARIKTLKFKVGKKNNFGVLEIFVKRCVLSKPTETPESIAYITIFDNSEKNIKNKQTNIVFNGWMFASSPALNALEHPVYDLILISCRKSMTFSNKSSSLKLKE